jgi:hypothetical protein
MKMTDLIDNSMNNRPSYILKPKVFRDGDQWCALFGVNLMEGVAGFGLSPSEAYDDFDKAWFQQLTTSDK